MATIKRVAQQFLKYVLSFFFMAYSLTIGLFTKKGQYIHSLICEYYGFAFLKPKLPFISWEQVASSKPIRLAELEVKTGNMPVRELSLICGIIRKEKPLSIFEIGTMNGRTTLNMALNSPEACTIYTLDLPKDELNRTQYHISKRFRKLVDKEISGELFLNQSAVDIPEKNKITQLLGDSGKFDFSPYYNSIDFIFIDGSHDYEYVLNDSEVALKLLREEKGVILWHDYRNGMEVVKAIEAFKKRHPDLEIYHIRDTAFAYLKK